MLSRSSPIFGRDDLIFGPTLKQRNDGFNVWRTLKGRRDDRKRLWRCQANISGIILQGMRNSTESLSQCDDCIERKSRYLYTRELTCPVSLNSVFSLLLCSEANYKHLRRIVVLKQCDVTKMASFPHFLCLLCLPVFSLTTLQLTEAGNSARAVYVRMTFARSNTGIVGSNTTQSTLILCCCYPVGRALATGRSPVQGCLLIVFMAKERGKRPRPNIGLQSKRKVST
jgi:hypothetical protein